MQVLTYNKADRHNRIYKYIAVSQRILFYHVGRVLIFASIHYFLLNVITITHHTNLAY